MSLPENHLDLVYTPGSIDEQAPRPKASLVIGALTLPLFFLVAFMLAYSSSLHAPVPHDMALTIAGPSATTSRIASAIDKQASSGFDITRTTSAADAQKAVGDRSAVGAIVVGGSSAKPTVTAIVASGGSPLAAGTIKQVAGEVAQQLGSTAVVKDVAPLWSDDASGSGVFYYTLLCTIGGFLTITVLFQVLPRARRRTKILTAVGAAVGAPILSFVGMAFSVGGYGMDFGHLCAVLGIGMLYTLVVALFALLLTEVLGQGAIFAVVAFCVAMNFPSTGGTAPESMLPGFWQAIHAVWFGSGALESFRSMIYFGGNGFGWPFVRLLIWLAGLAVALLLVYARKQRATANAAPEPTTASVRSDMGTEAAAVAAV